MNIVNDKLELLGSIDLDMQSDRLTFPVVAVPGIAAFTLTRRKLSSGEAVLYCGDTPRFMIEKLRNFLPPVNLNSRVQ